MDLGSTGVPHTGGWHVHGFLAQGDGAPTSATRGVSWVPFPGSCHLPSRTVFAGRTVCHTRKGNAVKTPFAKSREILALPETAKEYGRTALHLLIAIAVLCAATLLAVLGTR